MYILCIYDFNFFDWIFQNQVQTGFKNIFLKPKIKTKFQNHVLKYRDTLKKI